IIRASRRQIPVYAPKSVPRPGHDFDRAWPASRQEHDVNVDISRLAFRAQQPCSRQEAPTGAGGKTVHPAENEGGRVLIHAIERLLDVKDIIGAKNPNVDVEE